MDHEEGISQTMRRPDTALLHDDAALCTIGVSAGRVVATLRLYGQPFWERLPIDRQRQWIHVIVREPHALDACPVWFVNDPTVTHIWHDLASDAVFPKLFWADRGQRIFPISIVQRAEQTVRSPEDAMLWWMIGIVSPEIGSRMLQKPSTALALLRLGDNTLVTESLRRAFDTGAIPPDAVPEWQWIDALVTPTHDPVVRRRRLRPLLGAMRAWLTNETIPDHCAAMSRLMNDGSAWWSGVSIRFFPKHLNHASTTWMDGCHALWGLRTIRPWQSDASQRSVLGDFLDRHPEGCVLVPEMVVTNPTLYTKLTHAAHRIAVLTSLRSMRLPARTVRLIRTTVAQHGHVDEWLAALRSLGYDRRLVRMCLAHGRRTECLEALAPHLSSLDDHRCRSIEDISDGHLDVLVAIAQQRGICKRHIRRLESTPWLLAQYIRRLPDQWQSCAPPLRHAVLNALCHDGEAILHACPVIGHDDRFEPAIMRSSRRIVQYLAILRSIIPPVARNRLLHHLVHILHPGVDIPEAIWSVADEETRAFLHRQRIRPRLEYESISQNTTNVDPEDDRRPHRGRGHTR